MLRFPPRIPYFHLRSRAIRSGILLLVVGAGFGCGSGSSASGGSSAISREEFSDAMVELRIAAVQSPTGLIVPSDRDAILARLDITQEDLRSFVEIHGENVPLMAEIWSEIEVRLAERLGGEPLESELDPDSMPLDGV